MNQLAFNLSPLSPMKEPLSKSAARSRRDAGIDIAAQHADHVAGTDWTEQALLVFAYYLRDHSEPFLAEQFVAWSRTQMEPPPDGRAWGSVLSAARRRNMITRVGTAAAATSNLSPKPLWQRTAV